MQKRPFQSRSVDMHESSTRSLLRTPRRDGEVLLVPDVAQMEREVASNTQRLGKNETLILDRPLNQWRRDGRGRFIKSAQQYSRTWGLAEGKFNAESPLIVTGHQAQFYHCGIFIKYLLANTLAQQANSCAINLIVDSDLPKNLVLNLPVQASGGLSRTSLGWQGIDPDVAMEYQALPDKRQLDHWLESMEPLDEVQGVLERMGAIGQVMRESYEQAENLVEFYTLVNHGMARALSLDWLELPVSRLDEMASFWGFVGDLVVNCVRCHLNYNEALRDYRRENKMRNPSQPLPDLGGDAEGVMEMPFWVFRPGQPRRTLWVEAKGTRRLFFDGENEWGAIDFSGDASSEQIVEELQNIFNRQNIYLRPRALTLTIFMRLFLAEYFIHGIGGAIYDQITDAFIRKTYGFEAPAFAYASATVRLPFTNGDSIETIRQKLLVNQRQQRDLCYNPQRFVEDECRENIKEWIARRQVLIAESDRLKQGQVAGGRRSEVFDEIRRVNSLLVQENVAAGKRIEQERQELLAKLKSAEVMADREYFFGLFEPGKLGVLQCKKNEKETIRDEHSSGDF